MKKLSLFAASVSGALVCAAVPASFNWSTAEFSLDRAEARVGRPLQQRALLESAGESIGANTGDRPSQGRR